MRKVRRLVMVVNGVRWFGRPSEKREMRFQTAFFCLSCRFQPVEQGCCGGGDEAEGFGKIARIPRVGHGLIAAVGNQVGEFELFSGAAAELPFQFGQVVVVHGNDEVVMRRVFAADFAAGKSVGGNAVRLEFGPGALVHAFAVVPAGRARAGGFDEVRQAAFGGLVAQDVFGHRRAADVAEADKQDKVAVTACMRKLLTILNARMRDYFAENGTIENGIQTA